MLANSPIEATYLGVDVRQDELDDFSPAGYPARADLARATLAQLATAEPVDDIDRVTISAMRERLQLDVDLHESGLDQCDLNVLASPMQSVRDVFDLMPTDTAEQWATITRRLGDLPRRARPVARVAARLGRRRPHAHLGPAAGRVVHEAVRRPRR